MDVLARPDYRGVTFPGHHDGERILLMLRRHWFVLFTTALFFLVLLALPLLLSVLIPDGFIVLLRTTVWTGVVTLVLTAYYLFLWLFFFTVAVDYYLDVWIVTNERIVSIEQEGLFHRIIAEQSTARVQDVTSEVQGLFPTFLNFGHVFVQTAGERERFIFMQVPRPEDVKKVIIRAHEEAVRGLPQETPQAYSPQTGNVVGSVHPGHVPTEHR